LSFALTGPRNTAQPAVNGVFQEKSFLVDYEGTRIVLPTNILTKILSSPETVS
jgi:hypothetical protein